MLLGEQILKDSKTMNRYDLHCHTKYSECSFLSPKTLLKRAKKKKLNGIAICDHNTISGAITTKKLNQDPNFQVIIGEEVSTDKGHILGLYLKKPIKPGKFEDVIKEIKKQNGLVIIPHPISKVGLLRRAFKLDFQKLKGKIDAVETFNARFFFPFENKAGKKKALEHNFPQTGGSDGHFFWEVGRAYTLFEGDLRKALKKRKTQSKGSILLALPSRILSVIPKILAQFTT